MGALSQDIEQIISVKGIHKLSDETYFSLPYISKSGLDLVSKCPAHFKYWSERERTKTRAMDLGTAIHCAVLEPETFAQRFAPVLEIDRRTKEGKKAYGQWQEEHAGKIPLSASDWSTCMAAANAVFAHPVAQPLLMGGQAEVAMIWETPHAGADGRPLLAKAKVDYLNGKTIVDLKTTRDASREAFQESIRTYRYGVQAAYYSDGLEFLLDGTPIDDFVFIVVESAPPYHVAIYRPDLEMLIEGRKAYEKDLRTYAECMRSGVWPGLNKDSVSYISLPRRAP
jgi:exodeoxyribonuclease VIII